MQVEGDYSADGAALVKGLVPVEVATAFLHRLQSDLAAARKPLGHFSRTLPILSKDSIEITGLGYKPMITFLWGLTPMMSVLTGRDLLPTFSYFRIYRQGDTCRVHSDRPSSEHAVSLTLAYSDDKPWDLEMAVEPGEGPHRPADAWGAPYRSFAMQPGDAVLYQGVRYAHSRITPNPNRWSAHMFLFWVDRDGPHRSMAFDQVSIPERVEFALP